MAGHLDTRRLVRAPRVLTWEMATSPTLRHGSGRHEVLASDDGRGTTTLRISTPPDERGRVWTYDVERVLDRRLHTVYARRFNTPVFRYSHAWWSYEAVPEGTCIRCVQDFETAPPSPLDDRGMEEVMGRATAAGLREVAALVEAAAADSRPSGGPP